MLHEEVAAGQALAVQGCVGHGGVGLYLVELGLVEPGRDDHLAHAVLVLVVVGVELGTGQNLAGAGGHSGVGADDGTLDLMTVHEGFKDDLAVVLQSQPDGVLQLGAVVCLGDADAGTGVGGLDEDGPAQLRDGTVADAFEVGFDLPAVGSQPPGVGDAGGVEQSVGHRLIHADGAGQNAAAHVGDTGQLQQALHRAVLAPQAVQGRDDDIHVQLFHLAGRSEQDHAVVGTVRANDTGHVAGQLFPAAVGHLGAGSLGAQPAALFGDAHGQHFVTAGVEVVNEGPGGHAADLVLAGHAAEQHDDTEFLFRLHHDLS